MKDVIFVGAVVVESSLFQRAFSLLERSTVAKRTARGDVTGWIAVREIECESG